MLLEIITPDKKIYSGQIKLIQLPGSDGSFEIMEKHASMISSLSKGKAKVIDEQGEVSFFDIAGGICEVFNNKVIVLAGNI